MGKRGKKCTVSHEDRIQELRKHDICDADGKLKKESDPVWELICDNINNQRKPTETIKLRNLYRYVTRNLKTILIEINIANATILQDANTESVTIESDERDEEAILLQMQKNVFYKPALREVCTSPLTLLHWTIESIDFSKDFTKNTQYMFSMIGTFCKPFMAPDGSVGKTINLYALGTEIKNTFIPLCQMSSEDNSTSLFNRFFNECIRSGLKIPNTLILDYCHKHYLTANEVFNACLPYEDYLIMCYNYLTEKALQLPKVIIHTHIRFLVIKVKHWKSLCNVQLPSAKKFYLYCVIVLSLQDNMDDFQEILKSIFVISSSEFQNTTSYQCFEIIMLKIKNFNVETVYTNEEIVKTENTFKQILDFKDESIKINYDKCACIKDFIENIFIKAYQIVKQSDETNERNAFYNPEFCEQLMELCMEFVVWSNVIQEKYDIETIPSDFTTLTDNYKTNFDAYLGLKLNSKSPRLNEYLLKNIDFEYEQLATFRNNTNQKATTKSKQKSLEYSYMDYEENWMGLNNYRANSKNESDSESSSSSDSDNDESSIQDDTIDFEGENLNISTFIDSVCMEDNTLQTDNLMSEAWIPSAYENVNDSCAQVNEDTNVENQSLKNDITPMSSTKQLDETLKRHLGNSIMEIIEEEEIEQTEKNSSMNEKTIQRGKFLRPCEDIYVLQQKPTGYGTKRKVIKNSNLSAAIKINKERKIVATSSHFDSIVELLTSAYFSIQKFQDFITESTNFPMQDIIQDFFSVFQQYVQNFSSRELHSSRTKFLDNVCNSTDDKFCWTKPIGEFYDKIMPSTIIEKFQCQQCNFVTYRHAKSIKMSIIEIMSENIAENILQHLHLPDTCDTCGNNIFIVDISFKNVIGIDIEDPQNNTSCQVDLNKLVPEITIEQQRFILIGIIGFEEPIGEHKSRHYFACCRKVQGHWMKYDDTEASTKPVKINTRATINGALLIYIEYDKIQ